MLDLPLAKDDIVWRLKKQHGAVNINYCINDPTNDSWNALSVCNVETSPNRAGVAEHHLKIWDNNLGQHLGQKFGTDRQTNRQRDMALYRVALQLKRVNDIGLNFDIGHLILIGQ